MLHPQVTDYEESRPRYDLDTLFLKHGTDKASNAHDYAPWYQTYLRSNRIKSLCEIGVANGSSLRAWADWLPGAQIHGVDIAIDPNAAGEFPDITLWEMNACNYPDTLKVPGPFDVIIDDASHEASQVLDAAAFWHTKLSPGGWYIVEDLAANDWLPVGELIRTVRPKEAHLHGEILFLNTAALP